MSDHMVELDEGEVMPARKRPDSGDLDITPMIDITFLLLIFFIVTSNLDQQSAAKMPTAENGTSVATSKSAVLTVTPRRQRRTSPRLPRRRCQRRNADQR